MTLESARSDVARACRGLADAGLVAATAGNVSVRVGDLVVVTATGARFTGMTADQVTVVDRTGHIAGHVAGRAAGSVTGDLPAPTSELRLHLGIYDRYGSTAVVHTHPPAGTALACVIDELPVIHYQLVPLGGPIRVAPYATFGTQELADSVVEALDSRLGALMANHGAVTHGFGLDHAVDLALTLEWVSALYWRAAAIGTPRALDEPAQAEARDAWARYGRA